MLAHLVMPPRSPRATASGSRRGGIDTGLFDVQKKALSMSRAEELVRFSTLHGSVKRAWHMGYVAAMDGFAQDTNPFALTPFKDRHGEPKRSMDGTVKYRPANRSRLSWIAGWQEGSAVREGRFNDLMRRRGNSKTVMDGGT